MLSILSSASTHCSIPIIVAPLCKLASEAKSIIKSRNLKFVVPADGSLGSSSLSFQTTYLRAFYASILKTLLYHNPPSIAHGNVTVTVNTSVPGTTAEYICENNFKLIGEAVIACDSTGFWTSKPPKCELDKEKLYNAKIEGKQKRNRASIAARLNMEILTAKIHWTH